MSIHLVKEKTKLNIFSKYDEKLIQLIKSYEKRYYDQKTRSWSLSLTDYESFINQLNELNYKFELEEDTSHKCLIAKNGNDLEISFNSYVEEFPLFRTIKNSEYKRDEKKLIIPNSEKSALESVLKSTGIQYKCLPEKFDLPEKRKVNEKQFKSKRMKSLLEDLDESFTN
jgi:hypothetical protein